MKRESARRASGARPNPPISMGREAMRLARLVREGEQGGEVPLGVSMVVSEFVRMSSNDVQVVMRVDMGSKEAT